jgi:hypothetical protein
VVSPAARAKKKNQIRFMKVASLAKNKSLTTEDTGDTEGGWVSPVLSVVKKGFVKVSLAQSECSQRLSEGAAPKALSRAGSSEF